MRGMTSPEKTALINKSNLLLKDEFLSYLHSIQRSPGTIAGYGNDLLIVFTFVMEELGNKDFQKLTKRDFIRFQNWLVSNGTSSSRIRRLKSAISSLSNYCELILADDDPEFDGYRSTIRKIESPALRPVREKTVWTSDELDGLLNELIKNGSHEKACFLALAMYSGRRKSELCRFKVSDFSDSHLVCNGALYKSSPIKTKGRGGGKYIPCYTIASKFKPYLDLWMDRRATDHVNSEWLFPAVNSPTDHIGTSTVNSWSRTFQRMTGRRFYVHSLRHFFTTSLVRAGIPDSVITEVIGWESSDMCKVYTDMDADERISTFFSNGGFEF